MYSFTIPIPPHREMTPSISVEHLYSDEEIKTEVQSPDGFYRRLYIGCEFDTYGRGNEIDRFCINRNSCGNGKINIIDGSEKERVIKGTPSIDSVNYALSKMEFAEKVVSGTIPFDRFNFDNFIPIFEMIREIDSTQVVSIVDDQDIIGEQMKLDNPRFAS